MEKTKLYKMRHSCAHLLAAAVQSLFKGAQFGIGPPVENGLFYDIYLPQPLKASDLPKIEQRMKALQSQKIPFKQEIVEINQAIALMEARAQPFKVELLKMLQTQGSTAVAKETQDPLISNVKGAVTEVSLFHTGEFLDLCRGPHVNDTSEVGIFKVSRMTGAYWRGNAQNPQLQRIYALCFETKKELEQCEWELEQAARRDHRKVGKALGIFMCDKDIGPGLPLWLPNGAIIRDELEHFAREKEAQAGYQRVFTPHLTKAQLYKLSGHLPYYKEDMYAPLEIDGEDYYLRPMNCPHHHKIYARKRRSYRELPLRLSEYGQVYRYEASGGLCGLMRTRGFCQNDAHIYCSQEQAEEEFLTVMKMHASYYKVFGVKDFWMELCMPDEENLKKYISDPKGWKTTMDILRQAMKHSGYPHQEIKGEAAFYGPKVDFLIKSAIGTTYAISTNQLDFMSAKRFQMVYETSSGQKDYVYVIHRAPLGSHERFIAFLIEHYAGAFPCWLAPLQVVIIPITDRHKDIAQKVYNTLMENRLPTATSAMRIQIDDSSERMQKKIHNAQTQKVPYMIILGDKEQQFSKISVRKRNGTNLGLCPLSHFEQHIKEEITRRQDLPWKV